jgi:O-antigen ligase
MASFRRREIWELSQGSGFDGEVKFKIAIWILLGIIAVTQWQTLIRNSYLMLQPPLSLYVLYWALAMASTVYSAEPSLSLTDAGQLGVIIAFGLALGDRVERWPTLAMIYIGLNWAFLLIGLTGYPPSLDWHVLPGYQEAGFENGDQPWRLGTPIGHFSQISIVAAFVALASLARVSRPVRVVDVLVFTWMIATILLTVSRTAILGLAGGLLVLIIMRGVVTFFLIAGGAILTLILLIPNVIEAFGIFLERGQDAEDLATLTNRSYVWESAMRAIDKTWPWGYGFRADRVLVLNEQPDGSGVSHAHNAILEAMVGLGFAGGLMAVLILVGFALCAAWLLVVPKTRGQPERARKAVEFVALFVPLFAFSMLDSSFSFGVGPFTLTFIAVLIDFTRRLSDARLSVE